MADRTRRLASAAADRRSSRSTGTASCGWPSPRRAWRWPRRRRTSAKRSTWRGEAAAQLSGPGGLSRAGTLGLLERRPVPAGRPARRLARRPWASCSRPAATLPITLRGGPAAAVDDRLFNCAVLVHRGQLLGAVPKSYLPNYREFYEKRQFAPAAQAAVHVDPAARPGRAVRPGPAVRGAATCRASCCTSRSARTSGCRCRRARSRRWRARRCIANLSASDVTVGKADYRRLLCASQSAKCVAGYLYSAAGPGESTTDLAWDGHALIYENGERLAESTRFPLQGGFDHGGPRPRPPAPGAHALDDASATACRRTARSCAGFRRIEFELDVPADHVPLRRRIERFPYVPSDPARRDERCAEVYDIQVEALRKRLAATGLEARRASASPAGSTRRRPRWSRCARSTGSACRARNILGYTLPGLRHQPADVRQRARADAGARHLGAARSTSAPASS